MGKSCRELRFERKGFTTIKDVLLAKLDKILPANPFNSSVLSAMFEESKKSVATNKEQQLVKTSKLMEIAIQ